MTCILWIFLCCGAHYIVKKSFSNQEKLTWQSKRTRCIKSMQVLLGNEENCLILNLKNCNNINIIHQKCVGQLLLSCSITFKKKCIYFIFLRKACFWFLRTWGFGDFVNTWMDNMNSLMTSECHFNRKTIKWVHDNISLINYKYLNVDTIY